MESLAVARLTAAALGGGSGDYARLTRYRNCKFHNFARTISRHADGISRYSVPPSAGLLLPLRDAILTCARKPTRVSLIYRTETTTIKCKTDKLRSRPISKQSCDQYWRKKEVYGGKDLQKSKVLSLEWRSEGYLINNKYKC